MIKKCITIQDISCYGKCSITVALPVISSMGIETVILPTAVLSTHTSGFENFTYHDLTNEFDKIMNHWEQYDLKFDSIYTGYIGKKELVLKIKQFIKDFKKPNVDVVIDPVFADNGKIYPGMDLEYVESVKDLVKEADYIIPNITEACYLADVKYFEKYSKEDIYNLINKLSETTKVKNIILTGISYEENKLGAIYYNSETKKMFEYFNEEVPIRYHGTGDLFSSIFVGALLNGLSPEESMILSVDITKKCIELTYDDMKANYGVNFELCIKDLILQMEKMKNEKNI